MIGHSIAMYEFHLAIITPSTHLPNYLKGWIPRQLTAWMLLLLLLLLL
jgi:hypothetical protein